MVNMNNSGVDWIGKIPANWSVDKVKHHFINNKYIPGIHSNKYDRLSLTLNGVIHRDKEDSNGLQPKDFDTYQLLKKDELVFKLIDLQNISTSRVGLAHDTGLVSPAYIILHSKDMNIKYAEKFFLMMWHNKVFNALGDVGVRSSLSVSDLLNVPIIVPPLLEQEKISTFLDFKCTEIDQLYSDIEKQIETLEEYKKSVIFELVSGHYTSNETKKTDSNIWTDIPRDWQIKDIKYVFEIVKRIAGKEGFDILSVTQKGLKIKDISKNEGQIADNYCNYQFVYPTDYVMNHMDLLTGWVDCSKYFGVTSPDYRVFRLRDKKNNNLEYFKYLMQTCYSNRIFYSLGNGVSNLGRWRLQTDTFNNFKIPIPPIDTQIKIAKYLNLKIPEIDGAIKDKRKQLETLEQYKKSLIYEYVTGKKEVPTNE